MAEHKEPDLVVLKEYKGVCHRCDKEPATMEFTWDGESGLACATCLFVDRHVETIACCMCNKTLATISYRTIDDVDDVFPYDSFCDTCLAATQTLLEINQPRFKKVHLEARQKRAREEGSQVPSDTALQVINKQLKRYE